MPKRFELPEPECRYGYTKGQVQQIVGEDAIEDFFKWMNG